MSSSVDNNSFERPWPDNMNRDQLLADACVNIWKSSGDLRIGLEEDSDSSSNEVCGHELPVKKARRTVPFQKETGKT